MHSFEVHSNESACRKSGRLGLEQVIKSPPRRIKPRMGLAWVEDKPIVPIEYKETRLIQAFIKDKRNPY